MEWILTNKQKPLTYKTGEWDGKNSDNVIAEGKSGEQYFAYYCEGVLDGTKFEDWYTVDGWNIDEEIVRFLILPM